MQRSHNTLHPTLPGHHGWRPWLTASTPVPLQLDAISGGSAPLGAVLALLVLVGVCDGLAQGAIFADASLMPPWATQVRPPLSGMHCAAAQVAC